MHSDLVQGKHGRAAPDLREVLEWEQGFTRLRGCTLQSPWEGQPSGLHLVEQTSSRVLPNAIVIMRHGDATIALQQRVGSLG